MLNQPQAAALHVRGASALALLVLLLPLLALGALPACASGRPPSAAAPATPAIGVAKPAENLSDVEENLHRFTEEVKVFAASAADPSSVEDPNSFRARERAGEQRLSQRAAELRRRIHEASGTAPPPGDSSAGASPDQRRQQKMLRELDETQKQLDQSRRRTSD